MQQRWHFEDNECLLCATAVRDSQEACTPSAFLLWRYPQRQVPPTVTAAAAAAAAAIVRSCWCCYGCCCGCGLGLCYCCCCCCCSFSYGRMSSSLPPHDEERISRAFPRLYAWHRRSACCVFFFVFSRVGGRGAADEPWNIKAIIFCERLAATTAACTVYVIRVATRTGTGLIRRPACV